MFLARSASFLPMPMPSWRSTVIDVMGTWKTWKLSRVPSVRGSAVEPAFSMLRW